MLADRRLVIAALGVVVVLPLCFPRDLGALSWVSAAAVRPAHGSAPREGRREPVMHVRCSLLCSRCPKLDCCRAAALLGMGLPKRRCRPRVRPATSHQITH